MTASAPALTASSIFLTSFEMAEFPGERPILALILVVIPLPIAQGLSIFRFLFLGITMWPARIPFFISARDASSFLAAILSSFDL